MISNFLILIVEVCEDGQKGALTFLMIMTRKGSLMARVFLASTGQEMKLVETLVPMISSTDD